MFATIIDSNGKICHTNLLKNGGDRYGRGKYTIPNILGNCSKVCQYRSLLASVSLLSQAQFSPKDPWSITLTVGEKDGRDDWLVKIIHYICHFFSTDKILGSIFLHIETA